MLLISIIIFIILIILIAILFSTTMIEKFTDKLDLVPPITPISIYNISCGNTDINLDVLCNTYNTQKISISKLEQDYNSARRNTETKYELLNFAKNETEFKKKALDNAIVLNNKLNIRNKIEKTLNIINAVVAVKKIIILLKNGYTPSTIAYKNALDEYNKIVSISNAEILEINENGGYSSSYDALDKTIEKYNNAVFIAIATNTAKSKNLRPSISKTTDIDELINAQIAVNEAYIEINEKHIIPALNTYNKAAKDAKMTTFDITDNLSLVQMNAQTAYDNSIKSNKTAIALALSNYKTATSEEVDKFKLFYNAIKDLQAAFINYCHLLINPEIAYKSTSENNGNDECEIYDKLISDLDNIIPEVNKINAEIEKLKEKSIKIEEFNKVEETKNNVQSIFDNLKNSYSNSNNNEIINGSRAFLNKYIDLNTANELYYKSIVSYNQTPEKQEYNKKVIETIPIILIYDKIKNNIKRCYPDG